jgi:uncharacterized protein (DUF952 family)
MIFHIATQADWASALQQGSYTADSLSTQGFIHCSTEQQILGTANRYYKGRTDLVLLSIFPEKLTASLRYENLEGGASLFPHIYGPLNLEAVESMKPFQPQSDGTFISPFPIA